MSMKFRLMPRDRLAFWLTLFYLAIAVYTSIAVLSASQRAGNLSVGIWVPIIFSVLSLIIYAPGPSSYTIDEKGISIHRIWRTIVIPHTVITGIAEASNVHFEEHYGNGGLFSYYGTYRVKGGERVKVYATRLDKLVTIATHEITYYISPANAQKFVDIEQTYLSHQSLKQ